MIDLRSKVFDEGIDAYRLGVPRNECPYPTETPERDDLLRGWDRLKRSTSRKVVHKSGRMPGREGAAVGDDAEPEKVRCVSARTQASGP